MLWKISFCQNKCVLFLLSTAIIWGLYLPLKPWRTILHQVFEGTTFTPLMYRPLKQKSREVSSALNAHDLIYLRCLKDDSTELPLCAGIDFNPESNSNLSMCLLIPSALRLLWQRDVCSSSWGYCLVFGIHVGHFLFNLLALHPSLPLHPLPLPRGVDFHSALWFMWNYVFPGSLDFSRCDGQGFPFGYHPILTDWQCNFR